METFSWEQAYQAGPLRCGGKGYNLAKLHRYGFPVPHGIVIPAEAYVEWRKTGKLPDAPTFKGPVAVRSSATCEDSAKASFAGIHESFLNVTDISDAILGCYKSLWSEKAIAYRRKMGFTDNEVKCAVVIMEMVDAQTAGVAFSCDPKTGRGDVICIEAAKGVGVVSGAVTPERHEFVYTRADWKGPDGFWRELAHLVWRIHWDMGHGEAPQDVEWAHDGKRVWILQARPVTRVPHYTFEGVKDQPVIWSTANIKDAVPGVVSMLAWSFLIDAVQGVLFSGPKVVGKPAPTGLRIVKRIDGRGYFDLTAIQWCFYDLIGMTPAQIVATLGGHQPEIKVPQVTREDAKRHRKAKLRMFRYMIGFKRRYRKAIEAQFAGVREMMSNLPKTKEGILDAIRKVIEWHERLDPLFGMSAGYGQTFKDMVEAELGKIGGKHLLSRLMAGIGGVTSAEQGYRIADLAEAKRRGEAEFERELDRFLQEFGHRAVYEADLMNPRWADDPSYIIEQATLQMGRPSRDREQARGVFEEAWREVRRLTFWRRWKLRWMVGEMRYGFASRENGKSALAASMWPMRHLVMESGRQMGLHKAESAFHLSLADHMCYLRGFWDGRGAQALASDGEALRNEWLSRPSPPDVIIEGETPPQRPRVTEVKGGSESRWVGMGVSSGRATGVARIVRHPSEGAKLGAGEILVAPSTDPGWTPLFVRASAIVMEVGGYMSHGAIVAREYGLPAVVNVPGILSALKDGDRVTVDGDEGMLAKL